MKTLMTIACLMIASAFTASAQWYCEEDRDCSEGDFCATDKHCQTRTGPGMCPSTCGCPGAGPECIPPPPGFQSLLSSIKPTLKAQTYEYSKVSASMKSMQAPSVKVDKQPVAEVKEPERKQEVLTPRSDPSHN